MATLTKMFIPSAQPPPPASFSLAQLQENQDYYDPEQAVAKPRAMLHNEYIPSLQRQSSNLTMVKTHLNIDPVTPAEFPPQHVLRSTLGRQGDVQRAINVKSVHNPFNKSNRMFVPPPPPDDQSLSLQPPPPPPPSFPQ
jgi:hypothetical protein